MHRLDVDFEMSAAPFQTASLPSAACSTWSGGRRSECLRQRSCGPPIHNLNSPHTLLFVCVSLVREQVLAIVQQSRVARNHARHRDQTHCTIVSSAPASVPLQPSPSRSSSVYHPSMFGSEEAFLCLAVDAIPIGSAAQHITHAETALLMPLCHCVWVFTFIAMGMWRVLCPGPCLWPGLV